jgi:hypothetical protein
LLKYGTLEAILEARTDTMSPALAEQLRIFKRIVSMQVDVDVVLPETAAPNWAAAATELRRLGALNSAERLEARIPK